MPKQTLSKTHRYSRSKPEKDYRLHPYATYQDRYVNHYNNASAPSANTMNRRQGSNGYMNDYQDDDDAYEPPEAYERGPYSQESNRGYVGQQENGGYQQPGYGVPKGSNNDQVNQWQGMNSGFNQVYPFTYGGTGLAQSQLFPLGAGVGGGVAAPSGLYPQHGASFNQQWTGTSTGYPDYQSQSTTPQYSQNNYNNNYHNNMAYHNNNMAPNNDIPSHQQQTLPSTVNHHPFDIIQALIQNGYPWPAQFPPHPYSNSLDRDSSSEVQPGLFGSQARPSAQGTPQGPRNQQTAGYATWSRSPRSEGDMAKKSRNKQLGSPNPSNPPAQGNGPYKDAKIQLEAPIPTPAYLKLASEPSKPLPSSSPKQKLLIILDLNGALLLRRQGKTGWKSSQNPYHRPNLAKFLDYLFSEHHVVIFSSAMRQNVNSMLSSILPADSAHYHNILATFAREDMEIPRHLIRKRVSTFKRLSMVWRELQKKNNGLKGFDQRNTILIDDSKEKASSEPFNHVEIPDFTEEIWRDGKDDALRKVAGYIDVARGYENVSSYIRERPFDVSGQYEDPEGWKGLGQEIILLE